jgi:hypothetical protein
VPAEGKTRFAAFADGCFFDPADPEIEYRFSDPRDGLYQRLDYVSPLWPAQSFARGRLSP